jgi:hypothetical protein
VSSARDGDVVVLRIERADLHTEHWQKSRSSAVARMFREILRRERPDVVHVHHWRRLTRDLVHCATLERVPAVVSLGDHWTNCLIASRIRPDSRAVCEAVLAASPCLSCAQLVPPKTPWVPIEAQHMALAERERDLVRELQLARVVAVPDEAHAAALRRRSPSLFAGVDLAVIEPALGPARESSGVAGTVVDAWLEVYARARSLGPPPLSGAPAGDWYSLRMLEFAESEWDRKLALCKPRELGLPAE